ncbi:hypothetical protein ES705_32329 [subsurface metagenome]
MPIDYGWLATKIVGSLGPSRIEYHRKYGKTVWRMKPPHKRTLTLGEPKANPCKQWQHADALWVSQPDAWRQTWRDALKKPGMSGYDLWMKEALTLCSQNKYLPDEPSISGGWSTSKVVPGETWPPPGKAPPKPPLPPVDYFDCSECSAGTYQTFYGRLAPYLSDCYLNSYCQWRRYDILFMSCIWDFSIPSMSSRFYMWPPYSYVDMYVFNPSMTSPFSIRNTSGPLCSGGVFDIIKTESSPPCDHGDHSAFTFEIYPVEY